MKTRGAKMEAGDWPAQGVLDCGGKRSATPLSDARCPDEKRRRRCALPVPSKTWRRFVASLVFLAAALTAPAQTYSIDWYKVAGGGGTSTGGVYSVSGTVGQHDAGGPLTNGVYSLTGGYWALPIAVQTTNAPTLAIIPAAPGWATISWTPPTPGFVLQETASLAPSNWTNSPSGATNPIAVPAVPPAKFYRLNKP